MKNTMTTFTGRHFDPMQIRTEDICIEDIAHALSLMCRGGGHLKYFYSVAQHSLNCSAEAKRPVKANLTGYLEIESRIMEKILEKFNLSDLTEEERRMWKQIDDEMLYYELKNLMSGEEDLAAPELCALPDISERNWQSVETDFLRAAHTLISVKWRA